ncbi:growth-regulating factor 1-like [Carex rostrata]
MYPFTSSQWKELEQQALIFKYLASGLPIPSDLIMPIKKSFLMDLSIGPSVASPGFGFLPLHTPNGYASPEGWGCFQAGFGRRVEDPEPGRCRRTDGKKWRCSRESYGDSKYCERHMHRGKNRSRKLVELSLATTNTNSSYSSSSGAHNLHSSPYSPYSSFRTQSNGTGIGLSLGDDNHRVDNAAKKEPGEGKWCIDQFGTKGYGNGLTIDLTTEARSNPLALGSDLSKMENAQKPSSFHSFFN